MGEDRQLAGYDLSVSWAVDWWLNAGARPSQLTIGLGMYGRGWRLASLENTGFNAPATGACAKGVSTGEAGYRAFYEIRAEIAAGATKFYDEERQCPYILSGEEWVGYDDERSTCAKVQLPRAATSPAPCSGHWISTTSLVPTATGSTPWSPSRAWVEALSAAVDPLTQELGSRPEGHASVAGSFE